MSTTQSINDDARRDVATHRTTRSRGFMLQLLRKEARQLTPLLLVLIGCGVFLQVLGLFQQSTAKASFHSTILALIPILFAVGVGPLLVSQEKEQGTLRWMTSLPVPPRTIVASKLIVSLLGLIVTWCVSAAIAFAVCPTIINSSAFTNLELQIWPANTFFLLLMGFALAWILPTAGSTLVGLMVAASAATMFAAVADAFSYNIFDQSAYLGYLWFFQFVVTAILFAVAFWFGKRSFVTEAKSGAVSARASRREHLKLAFDRTKTPSLSPASGLIWQVFWQNRMLWVAAFFVAWMGLASIAYGTGVLRSPTILNTTAFAGCIVLSWLGASVFGSDANQGRIRFLTERGVSPSKIWWTRLALPLSSVIFGLLVFALMLEAWSSSKHNYNLNLGPLTSFSGLVLLSVLMTFGFAQWLPQWTRSTLIAFCISPVFAIFSLINVVFLRTFIHAPWWLLIASIAISFAATRIMLCPWMDGRTGLKYWFSQIGLLVAALVLPLIPILITFATYPDMPTALRRELTEEVKRYEPLTEGIELTIPKKFNMGDGFNRNRNNASYRDEDSSSDLLDESASPEADSGKETKDDFVGFADSLSESLDTLERRLSSINGPVIYSNYWMRAVIKEAQLMSLQIGTSQDESAGSQKEYRDRYHRSLILLSKFVSHMRMSDRLKDQEVSDQIEQWLVNELLKPNRKELFSDEEYSTMVATLANQKGRHQARRRAVVVAWHQYRNESGGDFGGLNPPQVPAESAAQAWLVNDRNVGQATAALLEYLESKQPASGKFPDKIQAFWPDGSVEVERTLQISDVRTPGALWHQDWETKAAELNESLK